MGYMQSVAVPRLRVDWKRLYAYKRGHLGVSRADPLKIDTSVDEDTECQSSYQIRERSIWKLRIDEAK